MQIRGVYMRIFVTDRSLDEAIAFYQQLTGKTAGERFRHGALELASVGNFLLIAGSEAAVEPFRKTMGTILVEGIEEYLESVSAMGCDIVAPLQEVATGRNMVVRHPDGSVFEYVEHTR